MKHDWKGFIEDIAGLLKTTGASGATGATADKSLSSRDFAGPTRRASLAPLENDWGHLSAPTGANHRAENIDVSAAGPTGPSGPTHFLGANDAHGDRELAPRPTHIPEGWREGYRILTEAEPHADFSPSAWSDLLADGAAFLKTWGTQAVQLGWRDVDVFGVHPVKPWPRVGCWGLALLIQGGNVIAITDKSATIRRRSGAILIWRRFDVEQVPLWQVVRGAIV